MSAANVVLSGPLILAIPVAAAAGAVTFLSPCCLPLVPGYLSYITGMSGADAQQASAQQTADAQPAVLTDPAVAVAVAGASGAAAAPGAPGDGAPGEGVTGEGMTGDGGTVRTRTRTAPARPAPPARGRGVAGAMLFILGFSVVFACYGSVFGALGQLLRGHDPVLTQVLGGLTILLGLLFAGVFDRFPLAGRIIRPSARPRAGLAGAPLLGVLFGVGWSPCLGPTLGAVLTLSAASGTATRGAFLAFVYGLGLGIPFLIVAMAFHRVMTVLGFFRRNARLVTRIGGAMLVVVGLLEVTGAWTAALDWLRAHWISGYELPL